MKTSNIVQLVMLSLLVFMVGCAPLDMNGEDESTTITLRSYGGFVSFEAVEQRVIINETHIVHEVYDGNGVRVQQSERPISSARYTTIAALADNDFAAQYPAQLENMVIADAGISELTINGRVIEIHHDYAPQLPAQLETLLDELYSIMASFHTFDEVQMVMFQPMACEPTPWEVWGNQQNMMFNTEQAMIIAYYEQEHGIDIISASRVDTDRIVCLACGVCPTQHYYVAEVVPGAADLLMSLEWTAHDDTTPAGDTLTFQPMQCEQNPWDVWYADGNVQFVDAPTQAQLIMTYYAEEHDINILSARLVETDRMVCEACGVCPTQHYYEVNAVADDVVVLQSLGWTST